MGKVIDLTTGQEAETAKPNQVSLSASAVRLLDMIYSEARKMVAEAYFLQIISLDDLITLGSVLEIGVRKQKKTT